MDWTWFFKKWFAVILPEFERGRHQDAHEFLRCLLDKLVDASIAPTSPSEEPSSTEESNIVKEIFGGCLKSQVCLLILTTSQWAPMPCCY